jgi:hypothetical protein
MDRQTGEPRPGHVSEVEKVTGTAATQVYLVSRLERVTEITAAHKLQSRGRAWLAHPTEPMAW